VLAYVFWHQPREDTGSGAYETALTAFHRSLAHNPPVGTLGSAVFRAASAPWRGPVAKSRGAAGGAWYEDWYLLADYTALGVLNEAAVGRGHRTTHDEAARRFGAGAGGLYGLIEGERATAGGHEHAELLSTATCAVWVSSPPEAPKRGLAELLGDGMDPRRASLWRRQLVLGPAPEYCLLAVEAPAGAGAARLPAGWTAQTLERELVWGG
jgi:hypothetical protein